jgi:threonine/homoserine/homoserine lactone efflux protein
MNIHLLISFLIGMIVLAATPGPGVFGSMAKAAAEGFKMSLFFIGGLVLGDSILLALALLGLSAIANLMGGMFYASVLPTIINFNDVRLSDAVLMMVLIGLVSFTVVGTYSYIASLTHKIQMSEVMQKRINQVAGFIMAAVGVFVMIQ